MTAITANGISIEVEQFGAKDARPLLLVRGLGSQLIHWPAALIDGFIANGFHVIAYDNRDAGLSQTFDTFGVPDLEDLRNKINAGDAPNIPYTLEDMAGDGIGVLNALGIERADVLGISMGGMIVQLMESSFPERICSATIIMSSSGNPALPARKPELERLLLSQLDDPNDREQVIEHFLRCDHIWGSPAFPFNKQIRRDLIARAYDRCHNPDGVARQYAAMVANGSRVKLLRLIRVPTLIIHGTDDPLMPIEHGRDIAGSIPNAEMVEIRGMGHDLEGEVCRAIVDATTRLARNAERGTCPRRKLHPPQET